MANWLQQIQSLMGNHSKAGGGEGLSKMLAPGALGGLAAMLIGSKSSRNLLLKYGKNALIVGGGATAGTVLWNKYKQRIGEARGNEAKAVQAHSPVDRRAERLVQALVFAAKSDGHIDGAERKAIDEHIHQAGLGEEGERLIQQAIDMPLDPQKLAQDVKNEEEALEVYFLSNLVIDLDHFMERSYLQALGDELKIPQDDRDSMARDIQEEKEKLAV
ncbi:tellurite resistance TerB family protein [Pantoea sp. FN060301]|uniref:tellurite resistance TerB family protein n=1 Tax=Pantoea sp. FN060301 TaxID=3420380 RepID=UPI003D187285